ncbi:MULTISPECIES: response regulator [unclassified Sphingobium]|uniref:response regulator n=1 Tax=unclassified Sphingobium TaxID=2611147 RepID=UPI0013774AF7|nr:response regulator [Sphingobium sp. Ant17]
MILLVESDTGLRRALHLLLMARGYGVKAYAEETRLLADPMTEEGACLIAEHRPVHVDGIDLLHQLRAAGWQHPVILTTTDHSAETELCARGAGCAHILHKPFAHHLLFGLVDRVVARGPG